MPRPERPPVTGDPLLRVEDLHVHFPIRKGLMSRVVGHVKAVDGLSFEVEEGETLKLEKIELGTGETVEFDRVMLVGEGESVRVGQPLVDGARVTAEVISQGRHDKINIVKFKRRKHHLKRAGHRQWYTEVKITGISG